MGNYTVIVEVFFQLVIDFVKRVTAGFIYQSDISQREISEHCYQYAVYTQRTIQHKFSLF